MSNLHLFIDEAAMQARVSVSHLRVQIAKGKLKAVKKAGRWRIAATELERWQTVSDEVVRSRPRAATAKARSGRAQTDQSSTVYSWDRPIDV